MSVAESLMQRKVHTLYASHYRWLHEWLRKKLGNSFDAADLAHDTFVRVMAGRRYDADGEPRAFLTHIAKGLVVDHWRRQEVERAYLDVIAHLPQAEVPSPEIRLLIIESLCRIEAMLASLPARSREIFLLSQLDGLTYADIAAQLNTTLITVKRHMRKAFVACLLAA